jgi:hypothetical protein
VLDESELCELNPKLELDVLLESKLLDEDVDSELPD